MRAKELIARTVAQLNGTIDPREAQNIAMMLLEDNHAIRREDLLLDIEVEVDEVKLQEEINRLLDHEPIQYVTGIADFYGRKFGIRRGVLVPRPETEELVHLIVQEHQHLKPRIWDVGTGQGCIAISLALAMESEVLASDISRDALDIAKKNGELLGAKVTWANHDILKDVPVFDSIDVLVSNPPYIPTKERNEMNLNITRHEPGQALFVPDDDPLIFYRRIVEAGKKVLNPHGSLYFEIHEHFGAKLKLLIEGAGYEHVEVLQDMQGKDRMVSAINSISR